MYGIMIMEVLRERREGLIREAELDRLKVALRTSRRRPATPRWANAE